MEKIIIVKIGQNGYQNAQNFILIPNLKTKFRNIKIYLEKPIKRQFFVNNFLVECFFLNFAFGYGISVKFCILGTHHMYWPIWSKKFSALLKKILCSLYSFTLWFFSRWVRHSTYMRRDAGEEGGREFSSKMPRTMSNLPDFPRCPFLYVGTSIIL